MKYNLRKNNLLIYINDPISKETLNLYYAANDIKIEKCVLYNDFIQSLYMLVFDTYLGDEFTDTNEQINHFKWCWNKNNQNFNKEGLSFESSKLYDYCLEFILEVFYCALDKKENDNSEELILKLWNDIFNYDKPKSNSEIDTLVEIYLLLNEAIIFK